jgi:pimeloyl-ACP methyl ester carboxylesterase
VFFFFARVGAPAHPCFPFLFHCLQNAPENAFRAQALKASVREGMRPGIEGAFHDLRLFSLVPMNMKLLDRIDCSVHIYHGTLDLTTPASMATMYRDRIDGAELHSVPGEGHLSLGFRHGRNALALLASEGGGKGES